nr:Basic leucine zipper domain containing protein [Haemonchus contortus]
MHSAGSGPKPPPPPLLSAQSSPSPPCLVRPPPALARHVLVADQEVVVAQDTPHAIFRESVLSSSSLSPFSKYTAECHQLNSPYFYDNNHEYPSNYTSSHSSSQPVAKSSSPFGYPTSYATSIADSSDLDFDYSHLISSNNIDDFGDDIAYGQSDNSSSASPSGVSPPLPTEPDFSFIDNIYESVRAEIKAEKVVSSPTNQTREASGTPPIITLGIDSPVTIVAVDGKEYKVVLQEVKEEPKIGAKRKASTAASPPKPKRAPGIPLANLSIEEINARKREQNRAAAQRYREKRRNYKESEKEEEERLEKRNSFLRTEAKRLQEEIDELRKTILGGVKMQ